MEGWGLARSGGWGVRGKWGVKKSPWPGVPGPVGESGVAVGGDGLESDGVVRAVLISRRCSGH